MLRSILSWKLLFLFGLTPKEAASAYRRVLSRAGAAATLHKLRDTIHTAFQPHGCYESCCHFSTLNQEHSLCILTRPSVSFYLPLRISSLGQLWCQTSAFRTIFEPNTDNSFLWPNSPIGPSHYTLSLPHQILISGQRYKYLQSAFFKKKIKYLLSPCSYFLQSLLTLTF